MSAETTINVERNPGHPPTTLLILLFASAALWLVFGLGINLLASIKLHAPALLANIPFLTYGRLRAVQGTALLYGFALQAAMGISAFVICRLRSAAYISPEAGIIAALFWNVGVTVGVLGLLAGQATGFDSFELPRTATPILFCAFLILGLCSRHVVRPSGRLLPPSQTGNGLKAGLRAEYVSETLISSSIVWFLWIFLSANLLLLYFPLRGVLQNATALWYQQNLNGIVLTFLCLAATFYFIPKLLNRKLYSGKLASVAVWTLALFATWGGLNHGAPLPRWMITINAAGTALTLIPLLAIAINFVHTVPRHHKMMSHEVLRYFYVGLIAFFLSKGQEILLADAHVNSLLSLTLVFTSQTILFFWGFVAMTLLGAIQFSFPAILKVNWPSRRLSTAQFWLFGVGTLLFCLATLAGGLAQAFGAQKQTLLAMRISTIGELLLLSGSLVFLAHIGGLLRAGLRNLTPSPAEARRVGNSEERLALPTSVFLGSIGGIKPLAIFLVMAVSWVGCVLVPTLQLENLQQTKFADSGERYPMVRIGLAAKGAAVYQAQGCIACHTQQIQPNSDITKGWGKRRTVARDYIFDKPPLLGSLRLGPDLANVGARLDSRTLLSHLYSPQEAVHGSVMPPYRYLFSDQPDSQARALVEYLTTLKATNILYETP